MPGSIGATAKAVPLGLKPSVQPGLRAALVAASAPDSMIAFDADQDCSDVAEAAAKAGVVAICRYLKNLSADEAEAIVDAGLYVVSIFESTAQRALQGTAAGFEDGQKALAQANALEQPAGSAIYATADFDATAEQEKDVLEYFKAFRQALGHFKLGVYANGAICASAAAYRIADYTWLAGGMGMRGSRGFAASGKATMIQDVGDKRGLNLGIDIDSDVILGPDFGGWHYPDEAQPPAKPPEPESWEEEIKEALARLGHAIHRHFGAKPPTP